MIQTVKNSLEIVQKLLLNSTIELLIYKHFPKIVSSVLYLNSKHYNGFVAGDLPLPKLLESSVMKIARFKIKSTCMFLKK